MNINGLTTLPTMNGHSKTSLNGTKHAEGYHKAQYLSERAKVSEIDGSESIIASTSNELRCLAQSEDCWYTRRQRSSHSYVHSASQSATTLIHAS